MKSIVHGLLLIFTTSAFALSYRPGMIPLESILPPAVDLQYKGEVLSIDEAYALQERGVDLSILNPQESDLWKNTKAEVKVHDLALNNESFVYTNELPSSTGQWRFNAFGVQAGINYELQLSKNIHAHFLRHALLTKLGYAAPKIQYKRNLTLNFDGEFEKNIFKEKLKLTTLADENRWIVEETDESLVLRDVLLKESLNLVYNINAGNLPKEIIRGRRVLSSLILPYALVEVPESINIFTWYIGSITHKHLNLLYPYSENFETSLEDARWIARRISKLTREDFEEIVVYGQYPEAVRHLMVEKLISRRNSLIKHLKIDAAKIKYNDKVSFGRELEEGKLINKERDYASRFTYGDPHSPFSSSELTSLGAVRLISLGLKAGTNFLNNQEFLNYSADHILKKQFEKFQEKTILKMIVSGQESVTNVGGYAFPFAGGSFILNRSVVAGSYMGANNLVQLADTIGVSMNAGLQFGLFETLPKAGASGGLTGYINRTYTHLRPISSVKKSLKTPFWNLIVPLHAGSLGKRLNEFLKPELTDDERQELAHEVIDSLKGKLNIGESFLVTDTLGASLTLGLTQEYFGIGLYEQAGKGVQFVSRFHITRVSEDIIQIYKDIGSAKDLTIAAGVKFYVPLAGYTYNVKNGKVSTIKYDLSLNSDFKKNPQFKDMMIGLKNAFYFGSTRHIKDKFKSVQVSHDFTQWKSTINAFFFNWKRIRTFDEIETLSEQADEDKLLHAQYAISSGKNYENFVTKIGSKVLSEYVFGGDDINLGSSSSYSDGYSTFGRAKNRITDFWGTYTEFKGQKILDKSFISSSQIWNGFYGSRRTAEKIIKEINSKYGEIFELSALSTTKSMFLYSFSVQTLIYEEAINSMLKLDEEKVREIFKLYSINKRGSGGSKFYRLLTKYMQSKSKYKLKEMTKNLVNVVNFAIEELTVEGFKVVMGGDQNFYIFGKIEGFRSNDENGDKVYISNSIGELGNDSPQGFHIPLMRKLNITMGEFMAQWFIEQVY